MEKENGRREAELALLDLTNGLDVDQVVTPCREGKRLSAAMEDQERPTFFRAVREALFRRGLPKPGTQQITS